MEILVRGGAGDTGPHMVRALVGHGHEVTLSDDLGTGYREAAGAVPPLMVDDPDAPALADQRPGPAATMPRPV